MRKKDTSIKLFCFSPPVMIATFVIEISLALYIIVRYHMSPVIRLIVTALAALGLFQLSEYFVCGGLGADASTWSRIGFVAITTLPAVGLHLLYTLSGNKSRTLVTAAYASMGVFMAYFLLSPSAFTGHECTGNYVIYQLGETATSAYSAYYFGWLLTSLVLGYRLLSKSKLANNVKQQITALMVGYLVFLIPTGIATVIKPESRSGIPSIMCGFAVLFALILALYIAPRVGTVREKIITKFQI